MESLTLKWGSIKGFDLEETGKAWPLLEKYHNEFMTASAALYDATREQERKQLLCDIIDAVDCLTIENDWTGKDMSKAEAKRYVMEYRA